MIFLPILIVCSLQMGYVGDTDSGPTCLKFVNRPEIHYDTHAKCYQRLREITDSVIEHKDRLSLQLPGPWHFRGHCYVPVIDETIA